MFLYSLIFFIYFLGSKKDCCIYGFDIGGEDGHVNLYQWSVPPGLREETEALAQAIQQSTSSLKRTVSNMSSSSTNSTTEKPSEKKKKKNSNKSNDDEPTKDKSMPPPPPLTSTITICDTFDTSDEPDTQVQRSNSNNNHHSSSTVDKNDTPTNSTNNNILLEEIKVLKEKLLSMNSLEEENKKLRDKVLSLEDEVFYLRNTLIGKYRFQFNFLSHYVQRGIIFNCLFIDLPDEVTYNYMKSITNSYEQRKADMSEKSVEVK